MRELGGYLEFEALAQNEYYKDAIRLNLARNAFALFAKEKGVKKVFLPYFLCSSVSDTCVRDNIPFEFYHTDKSFLPVFDKTLLENEYLYIVNYYGQLSSEDIQKFKSTYKNIIVDNVQAFFTKPEKDTPTIYSCRKFFGVPDGAYLVSDVTPSAIDKDVSADRVKHLFGRFDGPSATDYYPDFLNNEEVFDSLPTMQMSASTKNILGAIDYQRVIGARNDNWNILHSKLKNINGLNLHTPDGPYMYPFYVKNGGELRPILAKEKIFIPTLWPNVLSSDASDAEKDYSKNILPLPIDQRYNDDDMARLLDVLLKII